jgi:ATP-dependent RNA helicase DHX29
MAKKKKTALKPVARGFATTSVPKKVVEPVEEVNPETVEEIASAEAATSQGDGDIVPLSSNGPALSLEEQSIQVLVDKLQEKTEKDVVRTLKVVICHAIPFRCLDLTLSSCRSSRLIDVSLPPCLA